MASSAAEIEVFPWLKSLPLAPEYHPTLAEFRDPIGYIFKIEKEASKYGICKIVPPVSAPPKKTTIANLNRSLAARSADSTPTFTTRQQQIGFCPRKHRPVQKPVWQSGESYTLPQFEVKAKNFEKNYLKKSSKKNLTALEVETLYWKASVDKPFPVEYANDMPGSAFVQMGAGKKKGKEIAVENAETLGETEWNMRGVSRANGSLLKFMKEEIPGVTSPMVYIAMLFSWFAWHVEDHDLHSLNYMHMGAAKTWYGVPKEAAVAFEDVIRVHGYGGEINPIVTFATLSEKTTVMSPEVLLSAGVPCCRLVQNAGEFVVTFPRAYHSGLSHGFNCGEAANIATPGWLRVAKDAAIRRASINCAPMVSHFQLLYDLALSLSSRVPISIKPEPRSSRLRDKRKGEGEAMVKEIFVQDIMQNTDLLHILGKGSPIVILPEDALGKTICSNSHVGSLLKINPRRSTGAYTQNDKLKPTESLHLGDVLPNRKHGPKKLTGKGRFSSDFGGNRLAGGADNLSFNSTMQTENSGSERDITECNKSPDPGVFSCVTCGVLCYACVAIIQPTEAAAHYLMSANCSTINELVATSGVIEDGLTADTNAITSEDANAAELNFYSGGMAKRTPCIFFDLPVKQMQIVDDGVCISSPTEVQTEKSSLSLLALTYGDSSDSEDGHADERDFHVDGSSDCSLDSRSTDGVTHVFPINPYNGAANSYEELLCPRTDLEDKNDQTLDYSAEFGSNKVFREQRLEWQTTLPHAESIHSSGTVETEAMIGKAVAPVENTTMHSASRSDEDSSRMHIFCLQHASEIEQRIRPIGGVHILLLCHQDYPKLDAEAKSVAKELGTDRLWTDLEFREASEHDKKRIQSALESAEAAHGNGDWTVKLGINLFYSASLSRSPLYSKQMPYNSVIYNAFGYSSPSSSPTRPKVFGRQKKIVVAGKWCGKVWMSNQVHPLLAKRDPEEQEEDNISVLLGSAKLDVKLEIQSRRIRSLGKACDSFSLGNVDCAANSVMSGRKRKNNVDSRSSLVKTKFPKVEESTGKASSDTSPLLKSFKRQRKRNPRSKQIKKEATPQPHNDSSEEETRQQSDMDSGGEVDGGPSTRLRKRITKQPQPSKVFSTKVEANSATKKQKSSKKAPKKSSSGIKAAAAAVKTSSKEDEEEAYEFCCDVEGCTMSFSTKQELLVHKKNICPVKGCGKKFFSHKYLVQHRRVHTDDRPLKCPWKGCKMTFKWAWARTEHIRVHTGARPYVCNEEGCGQTFRFVSDFSRHKRRTGHSTKK